MNDKAIIEHLRQGKRDKAIKVLYKEFPKMKTSVLSHGGTKADAEEIFNDALLVLIEKVSQPSFELQSKLSTYLYGIVRFLWKNELRKRNKEADLEWNNVLILDEHELDYHLEKEERYFLLEKIVASLPTKCQAILERFYFKKQNMKAIAEALNFSSVNSAKTQKYKCMEKAIQLAKNVSPLTTTSHESIAK